MSRVYYAVLPDDVQSDAVNPRALYRIIDGTGYVARPGLETWKQTQSVLDRVTGLGGDTTRTLRIPDEEAMFYLQQWQVARDSEDDLPR